MVRKNYLIPILFFLFPCLLAASDFHTTEDAVKNAMQMVPSSYEFHEESGALIFKQNKNYKYSVISVDGELQKVVTYSSTQDEMVREEDPRLPVKEGDCSGFCLEKILCASNIFKAGNNLQRLNEQIGHRNGQRCRQIEVRYNYTDEIGGRWPMEGSLFVNMDSWIPLFLEAEQKEFGEDLYSFRVEVYFSGAHVSTCRIAEYRTFQTGQYGVFKYFFNTTRTFNY